MNFPQTKYGFTLVELVVSIAIFSVVTMASFPSVNNMVADNKLRSTGLMLYSDILLARSEALKRKTSVFLCRTNNALATTPTCGGDIQIWSKGWLLFVDGAGGTVGTYEAASDTLIKIGQKANKNILVKASASANANIEYMANGSLKTTSTEAVFAVCDDRNGDSNYDEAYGREIRISSIGKANLKAKNITSCELPS